MPARFRYKQKESTTKCNVSLTTAPHLTSIGPHLHGSRPAASELPESLVTTLWAKEGNPQKGSHIRDPSVCINVMISNNFANLMIGIQMVQVSKI